MSRYLLIIVYACVAVRAAADGPVVLWDGKAHDGRWSHPRNWVNDTPPTNPATGRVVFNNAAIGRRSIVDVPWTVQFLEYTNSAGICETFAGWPASETFTNHHAQGWTATQCQVLGDYLCLKAGSAGMLQSPSLDSPIRHVSFRFYDPDYQDGPVTGRVEVSSDGTPWRAVAQFRGQSTQWSGFSTNIDDGEAHRFRIVNVSPRARLAVDVVDLQPEVMRRHILDLGGHALVISNGALRAGFRHDHTLLDIQNGRLQLGTPGGPSDLLVGAGDENLGAGNGAMGATVVVRDTVLDAVQLRDLYVGVQGYPYSGLWYDGSLDLSGATVSGPMGAHTLSARHIVVGGGSIGTYGTGRLSLPPSLRAIEAKDFKLGSVHGAAVGAGRYTEGTLDLGKGSQLRELTVERDLWLGSGGGARIPGWPSGVRVTVGRPGAPGSLRVSAGSSYGGNHYAELTLHGGGLTATLDELLVGSSLVYNYGFALTGRLDLAETTVQIGDTPNALKVSTLRVGGYLNEYNYLSSRAHGELYLPPSITQVEVGEFQLARTGRGYGRLDFGAGSRLRSFAVTNGFYMGVDGGRAVLSGLPTNGLAFSVGRPGRPCPLQLGVMYSRQYVYDGWANLSPTGAVFSAYLTDLEIGVGHYAGPHDWWAVGTLDLSQSTLKAMEIEGDLCVGWTHSKPLPHLRANGLLRLPEGTVTVGGRVRIGDPGPPSAGRLWLGGTTVRVEGGVELDATAEVVVAVQGRACGLDILSDATNALSVADGGSLHILYERGSGQFGDLLWGLRMAGDHRAYLEALHAAEKLTWESRLPASETDRLGIYYSTIDDKTYVGFRRPTEALLILE